MNRLIPIFAEKEAVLLQYDILNILSNTTGYVSGQQLAQTLGVSRQAVWKSVNALRESGCEIESVQNRGYRLVSVPGFLNETAVKAALKTKIIGQDITVLDSVGSTNDYLKALGARGCKSGTVVAAREQVSGKGRLGRVWQSQRDENVMFSVLLRPQIAPSEAGTITPLTGVAVCRALRTLTGLDCKIKWPNDIIIGKKKLVGILTEMSAEFDAVEFIIIGVGINVGQKTFPEDISHKATSLFLETGKEFDKNYLLAAALNELEKVFLGNNLELSPAALDEYKALCATLGKNVTFIQGGKPVEGTATDISENGELIVSLPGGRICRVNSGEVTAQGIY